MSIESDFHSLPNSSFLASSAVSLATNETILKYLINLSNQQYYPASNEETNNSEEDEFDTRIYYQRPEEVLLPWFHNAYFFPTVITNILTFIFGVSGNSVVIWFMFGDKANHSATSIFLVSLAISDLLLLTIVGPLEIAHYFVVQWDSDGTVCKLSSYVESVSAFASVLNLVAVTFERFVVIVFPIRSRSICTMENCKQFVITVWILALLLATPTIYLKEVEKSTFTNHNVTISLYRCKGASDQTGLNLNIYRFIFLFALPSVFMIASYVWVIIELWISTKTMDDLTNHMRTSHRTESRASISRDACSSPNNHAVMLRSHHATQETRDVKSARKQVIKMLILVVILFLICWGPRLVIEIIINCCLTSFTQPVYIFRIVFFLLPFIHSCLNPIVYCLMSSKFRKKLFTSLRRCLTRRGDRVANIDSSMRTETSGNGHLTSIYTVHTSFDYITRI
uniref:G-protein coupled receptors family 1 profile domain-containing protein n=1 Tax=Tetranychus urticae TaxID=32264 RepID=T1KET0_TETUR